MSDKAKTLLSAALGLCLWLPAAGQPADPRPQEPAAQQPPPRTLKQTLTPDREAVWLFEEGKRLQREGQTLRALDAYRKALAKDPGRVEYRPYLALVEIQAGRYQEAKEQYDLYLRTEPKDSWVRLQRVWALICLGEFEDAEKELNGLKLIHSANVLYYDLTATMWNKRQKYGLASQAYQTAVQLDRSHRPDLLINLARALFMDGRMAESEKLLEPLLSGLSKSIVLNNLGVLRTRQGQSGDALKLFEQAWQSQQPDALYNLSNLLADQGKTREAILSVAKLLDLAPDNLDAQMLYTRLLVRQSRVEEARKLVDRILNLGPTALGWRWPYVCELAGLVALQQDDNEVARHQLEQAVLGLPKSPSAHHNLALALSRQGQLDDALNEELTAIGLSPQNPSAWFHLGVIYDLLARPTKAIEAYDHFLQLRPEDPESAGVKAHIAEIRDSLQGK